MANTIIYKGHKIALAEPWNPPKRHFAGRAEELRKCLAAWKITPEGTAFVQGGGPPLNFRLQGPPGVGKNEIVYQIARLMGKPLYIIQGHEELTPEDMALLLVPDATAEAGRGGTGLILQASPLASAILTGGLFFFDEINRVPERALSPLASVLDERRSIYSAITGLTLDALPGREGQFRFCCALNPILSEAGRGVLPDYIEERTLPVIEVQYLKFDDTLEILRQNLQPTAEFLAAFQDWHAQKNRRDVSVRQYLTLMNYTMSLAAHANLPAAASIRDAEPHVFTNPDPAPAWQNPPADDFPPALPMIKPPPDINDGYRRVEDYDGIQFGQPYLFEVQGDDIGPIWGSGGVDLYTADTQLGTAAVHAGLLKLGEVGVLQVTVFDTSDNRVFHGSEQNGVHSSTWTMGWSRGYRLERSAAGGTAGEEGW